jgi:hypothetical protein
MNGTDSRLFLWFICACALAGVVGHPRCSFVLVGHPSGSSRFQAPSPSFRSHCCERPAPALVSFAPLQSSCFKARVGGCRPLSLGIRPGCSLRRRHRCRSAGVQPDLFARPSTCSPASTPARTLLPSLRSQSATFGIPFRPHRFARSRRLTPPIAPLAWSFAPLLAQDSRACCIPLPILGFAAFLAFFGWVRHPKPAIAGRLVVGHAKTASSPRISYPSKNSPHRQPCRVAATVAPVVFCFPQSPSRPRRSRCRLRRTCPSFMGLHLRGVAPPMSPYRYPPFPACSRPILPGLCSPSRSFDLEIAPEVDASRTLCASIPAIEILVRSLPLLSFLPAETESERASLRSALASSRTRPAFRAGEPRAGHGGEGFIATFCREARRRDRKEAGVLGRKRLSTLVLGSREDPPGTPFSVPARLPSNRHLSVAGPHPPKWRA